MADSSISVAAFFISRIKMYGTSCERKDMKTNQIMIRPMGEVREQKMAILTVGTCYVNGIQ